MPTVENRCPWAIRIQDDRGVILHTRCHKGHWHATKSLDMHEGPGLEANPDELILWFPSDSREYWTSRPDEWAWEGA